MLNHHSDAIKVYLTALALNPNLAECHFNLASAYNDSNDIKSAILHYKQSLELDPNNMDAYHCLGAIYETRKTVKKA